MVSTPTLVPYRAEHTQEEDGTFLAYDKERRGPAFSAVYDGHVIGSAGIMIVWRGVGLCWTTFCTDLLKKWPVWTTRMVRTVIRDTVRSCKLHRLELVVRVEDTIAQDWAASLGFSSEGGIARAYTSSKEDVYRYQFVVPDRIDQIHIRPMMQADYSDLLVLLEVCDTKWLNEPLAFFTKDNKTLVALHKDKLIGYTIYQFDLADTACVGRNIGVHHEWRGYGVADRLHKARLSDAVKHRMKYFVGMVHGDNQALVDLFTRNGAIKTVETFEGTAYVARLRT